jgi:hypothetical protein
LQIKGKTMTLIEKVSALERFKKTLVGLSFTVSITKTGHARVKYKKKIVIAECPDKDSAELFSMDLNKVVKNTQERINQLLLALAVKCEQTKLFSKDSDDGKITGPCEEEAGRTIHPDSEDTPRPELPTGLFNRSGPCGEPFQYGSVGVDRGISLP